MSTPLNTEYKISYTTPTFTISWTGDQFPNVSFSQYNYLAYPTTGNYFMFGVPDQLTMLDYTLCTNPVETSIGDMITAISNMVVDNYDPVFDIVTANQINSTSGSLTLSSHDTVLINIVSGSNTIIYGVLEGGVYTVTLTVGVYTNGDSLASMIQTALNNTYLNQWTVVYNGNYEFTYSTSSIAFSFNENSLTQALGFGNPVSGGGAFYPEWNGYGWTGPSTAVMTPLIGNIVLEADVSSTENITCEILTANTNITAPNAYIGTLNSNTSGNPVIIGTDGLQFPTQSVGNGTLDSTTLHTYAEWTGNLFWTTPTSTNNLMNVQTTVVRVGGKVIVQSYPTPVIDGSGSASNFVSSALPSFAIPASQINGLTVIVDNGGTYETGVLSVSTSGVITISPIGGGTFAGTSTLTYAIPYGFSVSYNILSW